MLGLLLVCGIKRNCACNLLLIDDKGFLLRSHIIFKTQKDRGIETEIFEIGREEHEKRVKPGLIFSAIIPKVHKRFVIKDHSQCHFGNYCKYQTKRSYEKCFLLLVKELRYSRFQSNDKQTQSNNI